VSEAARKRGFPVKNPFAGRLLPVLNRLKFRLEGAAGKLKKCFARFKILSLPLLDLQPLNYRMPFTSIMRQTGDRLIVQLSSRSLVVPDDSDGVITWGTGDGHSG